MGFFQKYFVPHASNKYHPYSTRYYALVIYCLVFFAINIFAYPLLGLTSGHVLASSVDPDEIISLANAERKARGLGELQKNPNLITAAIAKGNDMMKKQYWSHFGPNGETPWQFIKGAGYNYIYAGENLAKDFATSREAHVAWMNSPTHRANILNANYRDIGVSVITGIFEGKKAILVVQMFGSKEVAKAAPKPNQPAPTPTQSQIESYKPNLVDPADQSIFGSTNIRFSGDAEFGDTIKVYSNDQLLGELPKDKNNFTVNIELLPGPNKVYIKTKDTQINKESLPSDSHDISIDVSPPDISKINVKFYAEGDSITVTVSPEEPLATIDANINGSTSTFTKKDESFFMTFDSKSVDKITLVYYDDVGNTSVQEFNLDDVVDRNDSVPAYLNTTQQIPGLPFWQSFFDKLGMREKINFILVIGFFILVATDAYVVMKRGHIREWASHHGFHIALVLVMMVGLVTI